MKSIFVFATILVAAVAGQGLQDDSQFDSYPEWYIHSRQRRGVSLDSKTGEVVADHKLSDDAKIFGRVGGTEDALYGKGGYEHTLFDDDRGKLDASAYGTRVLSQYGDSSHLGGGLSWQDKYATAGVDLSRQIGGHSSVHAKGGGKWPTSKNSDFSLQGTYDQTFGRRPDYGVLGSWQYRFP